MYLSLDLETLGVSTESPVISIGAALFNKKEIVSKFEVVLDVEEQMNDRIRFADGSTIKWWMQQEDAAKKVFKESCVPTRIGLISFVDWLNVFENDFANLKPFGNGATFDVTILETLLKDYDVKVPWHFSNIRDLRTFKEFIYDGSKTEREGVHHNALDDAVYQAQIVIDGLNDI